MRVSTLLLLALALALALVLALPALATPPEPDFQAARTTGVLPVLATGASRDVAWDAVERFLGSPTTGSATAVDLSALSGESGFGFAGKATGADILILKNAIAAGMLLGLVAQGHEPPNKQVAIFVASQKIVFGPLTPGAQKAMADVLAAIRAKRFAASAAATLLREAEAGIAVGPQRGHGYLAVGFWLGLAPMVAGIQGDRSRLSGMAAPLAVLLREDAAFGGADHKLAAAIESVAGELQKKWPSAKAIRGHIDTALALKPETK